MDLLAQTLVFHSSVWFADWFAVDFLKYLSRDMAAVEDYNQIHAPRGDLKFQLLRFAEKASCGSRYCACGSAV